MSEDLKDVIGPEKSFYWNEDCKYFRGGLPCEFQNPCHYCSHYSPTNQRILIVMLGMLGDMLIASPLPARIKRENQKSHITWLVDESCAPVLGMNPHIDKVLIFNWESATHLLSESFDFVYCFERTPSAASLVDRIKSKHKAGLAYGGKHNSLYSMGKAAEHFFKMNTWNDYRTRFNDKTWTELYFEVAGYKYNGEPYVLNIPVKADCHVRDFLLDQDKSLRICMNVGGSLSTKIWPKSHWLTLGKSLLEEGFNLVIAGGINDANVCNFLYNELNRNFESTNKIKYLQFTVEEFSSLIGYCDLVVTGDTFGFHVALAHNKPCVLMLGPSNGAEVIPKHIDNISTLRSSLLCSPCAHQVSCGGVGGCMETILPSSVFNEVKNKLGFNNVF